VFSTPRSARTGRRLLIVLLPIGSGASSL